MSEAEARAAEVLSAIPDWVWRGGSPPVPIEEVCETCFGLHVRDVEDLAKAPGAPQIVEGQALSGLLLVDDREIWVDASETERWPRRRRFTIAHELGHWLMHINAGGAIYCRATALDAAEIDGVGDSVPEIEEEANDFAATLLMPGELVRGEYARLDGDFDGLCESFDCSRKAMGKRLHQAVPRSVGR